MKLRVSFGGLQFHSQYHSVFRSTPRSVALFCPYCFAIWASFTETDERGRTETYHFVESVPCAEHPAWNDWTIPGSLIQRESNFGPAYDLDIIPALPLELLAREFDLHVKHLENLPCSSLTSSPLASPASPPELG